MKSRTALVLALGALFVAAAACSSEPSEPVRVTNYGQAQPAEPNASAPPSYWSTGSPDAAPAGAAIAGTVNWHYTLADAQAEARATGKLILALATKPRCGLCKKFKTSIAPSAAGELNRVAVGYVYDILRPEVRQVDETLRANLRGADLMPLVGFLTPDLRWVHGFYGARTVSQFRGDIATARRIHPVRSARVETPNRVGGPSLAVLNEFGEPEWSPPGDIWPEGDPEPIDAITGSPDATVADRAAAPPQPVLADAMPAAPLPARDALPDLPAPPAPAPAPAGPAPTPEASIPALAPLAPGGAVAAGGSDVAAPAGAPAPKAGDTDLASWGHETLQRALAEIRAGRFAAARDTLSRVHQRMPGTSVAREASKGGVALYNAKRIRLAANGTERNRYLSRARRDFSSSMWGVLFNS